VSLAAAEVGLAAGEITTRAADRCVRGAGSFSHRRAASTNGLRPLLSQPTAFRVDVSEDLGVRAIPAYRILKACEEMVGALPDLIR
jgi:hypothetical protein